ncbi:MAG: hypothetical protein EBU90_04380 [Proteobacteria bacterium]|nr:hypothetical protein [Pseudomonadota bacterium]NBP15222.1 hypothetical protein [bacterium]
MFKVKSVSDLELLYSVLREEYPDRQIKITFNHNTKEYTLVVTKEPFVADPEVPLDLEIEVVYGDSVTGDTPLLLKRDNTIYIETIQSIFKQDEKFEYPGFKMFDTTIRFEKEYCSSDYQVWTDIGWVDIKKVIRHKCEKKIYRVLTHTGCIDVTEDHSLITHNKEPIKPKDLKIGDELLHSFPKEFTENEQTRVSCSENATHSYDIRTTTEYILTKEEAELFGFFMNCGDLMDEKYQCGVRKCGWELNNNDLKRLNYFKDILESVEPIKFEILDTLKSSGVYKLVPKGSIKYMADKYRRLFYYQQDPNADGDKFKIVPNCILNARKEIKWAYWKGYYEADGAKTCGYDVNKPSFAVKDKIGAQCMYYLMRSIGFDMGINLTSHPKKQEIYRLSCTTFRNTKETVVKKIIDKGTTNDYVYDLETTIGRFGCGVGQLQVKNTDSIFLKFRYNLDDFNQNRLDTFRLATICGEKLTSEIFARPPIEMEFEKVFQPFVLLTKKRYIANKYENMKDPFQLKGLDAKGIALTRRDYCRMVKACYKEIIDAIMDTSKPNNIERSIRIFRAYVDRIDNYDIDIEDLVVSAMLAKSYKTKPVHVLLAEKLKARKEEVQIGDRIPYLYIESDDPKQAKSELGEDPQYAIKHGLKFNRKCYLEQLAKPILGFYKIVLMEQQNLLDDVIGYVNNNLVSYGAKPLKPSDFKIED